MWSGPRNISTAMMRSWGARPDTAATDEPLYGRFLKETGTDHPGRNEVIAQMETDYGAITGALSGPIPGARAIWYQKHMAHHILDGDWDDLAWLDGLTNCMLIRDPGEMITSYIEVIPNPTAEDLGLPQQQRLAEVIAQRTGAHPPVLDARDVLEDPHRALTALCDYAGVAFDVSMLSWPPGPRPEDGVWGKWWYANVWKSTGFAPYQPKRAPVPARLRDIERRCRDIYEQLREHRIGR